MAVFEGLDKRRRGEVSGSATVAVAAALGRGHVPVGSRYQGQRRGDGRGARDPWRPAVRLAPAVGPGRPCRSAERASDVRCHRGPAAAAAGPPPPPKQNEKAKPKDKEGGSSPKNIKSEATPVAAPKPRVEPLLPNPVVVTEVPRQGAAPTQGAAERARARAPARAGSAPAPAAASAAPAVAAAGAAGLRSRRASFAGSAGAITRAKSCAPGRAAARIDLIFRIEANGRPSSCRVGRSFGNPIADQWTCSLMMQRGQFRPALNARGQACRRLVRLFAS